MKVTYEYSGEDDFGWDEKIHRNGGVFYGALHEVRSFLRDTIKYDSSATPEVLAFAEKLQDILLREVTIDLMNE